MLRQTGLDPGQLVLEITESMLLDDTEERIEELERLKRLGVRLAIDDFGIGYSSFNYLRRMTVDTLKRYRAFVARLEEHAGDRTVARAIIELGGTLGLQVIAEGIQTEAQRAIPLDLGCTIGQGYLFGHSVPA